jgi:hypothetical protein
VKVRSRPRVSKLAALYRNGHLISSGAGFSAPALLEHQSIFARRVEIEGELIRLWPIEWHLFQAILIPAVQMPVIAAEEFGRKVLSSRKFVKNGVKAYRSAEQRAKIENTPAFELVANVVWDVLDEKDRKSLRLNPPPGEKWR